MQPAAARAIGFGPFQVDPRTRELRKGGSRIRVPEQSVRILLALLDRAGDVVTRDELAALLWTSDTVVDVEHGLNSAVRRLRDALSDSAEHPLYIETVPRVGYRFVGSVAVPRELPGIAAAADKVAELPLTEAWTQPGPGQQLAMANGQRRRWLVVAAMVMLAAIAGIVAVVGWRGRWTPRAVSATRSLPVPLTFDGGLQTDPSVSPDGQWIAYASDSGGNFDIWTRRLSGGDPVQVTTDDAADSQPDWSPDGSQLVFRSERAGGGLFIVPVTGGAAQQVSRQGFRPRWSPDGLRILFAERILTGLSLNLQLIDVAAEVRHRWPGPSFGAFGWSPGSSTVLTLASLFGEYEPSVESWTVGDTSQTRWVVEKHVIDAFRMEQLVVVAGEELISSPGLSSLHFIGASRGTRALWRIDIDETSRHVVSGPHRLTTLPNATNASGSPDGRRVVFDGSARNAQILSYAIDSEQGRATTPVSLTSDAVHAEFPTVSRDGRAFAFVLTRPGSPDRSELVARWAGQPRDRAIRVIKEPREVLSMPRWNGDGTTLVYALVSNAVEPSAQQQLRLFDASSGEDTPLTSPHSVAMMESPSGWAPDGRHILVTRSTSEPALSEIALVPIDASPAAERSRRLVTSASASLSAAVMSPNAKWIAFRVRDFEGQAAPRIAIVSAAGGDRGAWTFVTSGVEAAEKPCWSDDGETLYFTSRGRGATNVWAVRFDTGRGVPIGEPWQVTAFEGPGHHILSDIRVMELAAGGGRLVLPVVRPKGGLWMLQLAAP